MQCKIFGFEEKHVIPGFWFEDRSEDRIVDYEERFFRKTRAFSSKMERRFGILSVSKNEKTPASSIFEAESRIR